MAAPLPADDDGPELGAILGGPVSPPRHVRAAAELVEPEREEVVHALRALILAGEAFRHVIADHLGVGVSETVAMSHLATGPLTPRELADRTGLTPSTITSLLDRLEAAGLANRQPHPTDRRKSVVVLTEAAQGVLAQVRDWLSAAVDELEDSVIAGAAVALFGLADALDAQSAEIKRVPRAGR